MNKPLDFIESFPEQYQERVRALYNAVWDAALPLTDAEIEKVVRYALARARMALSS